MLTALTTGVRLRVAALVAVFAVFSFVAPPIALAFASGKTAAVYCLTHPDQEFAPQAQVAGSAHDLEDSARHSHGDHKSACCCLFSVTALVPGSGHLAEPGLSSSEAFSALEASLYGLMRERLDRPPISLRSF
jgi:hypothetical protein